MNAPAPNKHLAKEEFQGSIYRFLNFDGVGGLVDIIQNQALMFVHHTKWEDPYEGYIYQAIMKRENHAEIQRLIKEISPNGSPFIFSMLHDLSTTLFGQSWTKEGEKLWDLYPPNNQGKCTRIQINTESLKTIVEPNEWEKARAFEIEYVEEPDLKEELSLSIKDNQVSFGRTLLRKRKSLFEHEQEVRLALMDWDYSLINRRNFAGMIDKVRTLQRMIAAGQFPMHAYEDNVREEMRVFHKLRTPDLRKVSFSGIQNFIESVAVHPDADTEYVRTVEVFCDKHGLNFLGKATKA